MLFHSVYSSGELEPHCSQQRRGGDALYRNYQRKGKLPFSCLQQTLLG